MNDKEIKSPELIYFEDLLTINGILFTPREIDVIACLLSARGTKKIASFLSILPKTVRNHIHNIMIKLACNSRDRIIDFIERSNKLPLLKKHYIHLLIQSAFEKSIKEISRFKRNELPSCLLIYWVDKNSKKFLVDFLETHLKLMGIKVSLERRKKYQSLLELLHEPRREHQVIYVVHNVPVKEVQKNPTFVTEETSHTHHSLRANLPLFLFSNREGHKESSQAFIGHSFVDFTEQENYYFLFFEILRKLFPNINNIEKIFSDFKQQYEATQNLDTSTTNLTYLKGNHLKARKNKPFKGLYRFIIIKNKFLISILFLLISLLIMFLIFKENNIAIRQLETLSIRSDLSTPSESVFLNRPELISKIDDKLKRQKGIQSVALIGIGGIGKTTVARYYALQQKASVIWEINAETNESLYDSFERLASVLSKTDEDRKALRRVQEIQNPTQRIERLFEFAKEKLKHSPNWFLIFDNVEKFTDIQKYFPHDVGTWGQGKIILTTRDGNIKNNKHVHEVIQVEELSPDQKLNLFFKILGYGEVPLFKLSQAKEAKEFLENIPPFPLDVSLAAYYLKSTNASFKYYLNILEEQNSDFLDIQEKLLKESGDYTKTRYSIIAASIHHLLKVHKDFSDLLLFVSLIDSQNVPVDLLRKYKSGVSLDNFIYHLKKYSLINNESQASSFSFPLISIHRCTQQVALAYLTKMLKLKENPQILQPISNTIENFMIDAIDKEDISSMKFSIRHAETFLNHSNLLTNNIKGSIHGELGRIYLFEGKCIRAITYLEKSISELNKHHNKNFIKIAHVLAYLGIAHRVLGNYQKAKDLLANSYSIYKPHSSKYYSEVASILAFLGDTYRELGNYAKAQNLLDESIIIYKKHLSENHAGLARALTWLGMVYRGQGKYQKAQDLLEESYRNFHNISKNHTGVAMTLAFLGNINNELGYHKKAKDLLERSLIVYKQHFSEEHVAVARAFAFLGAVNGDLGEYDKAKDLLNKSLAILGKNLSKEHTDVNWALTHLGIIHRALGNYDKAKKLFEDSIKSCEKHPVKTAYILKNLGQTYFLEGNMKAAEDLLKKSLSIFQHNKHPRSYICLESLAELFLKKSSDESNKGNKHLANDSQAQATTYLKQALQIVKIHFPKDSAHLIRIQDTLKNLGQE